MDVKKMSKCQIKFIVWVKIFSYNDLTNSLQSFEDVVPTSKIKWVVATIKQDLYLFIVYTVVGVEPADYTKHVTLGDHFIT